jgi:Leucine-rich repeat (LRR) protein
MESHGIESNASQRLARAGDAFRGLARSCPDHWAIRGLLDFVVYDPILVDMFYGIPSRDLINEARRRNLRLAQSKIENYRYMRNDLLLVDGIASSGKITLMEEVSNLLAVFGYKSLVISPESRRQAVNLAHGIFKYNTELVVIHLDSIKGTRSDLLTNSDNDNDEGTQIPSTYISKFFSRIENTKVDPEHPRPENQDLLVSPPDSGC